MDRVFGGPFGWIGGLGLVTDADGAGAHVGDEAILDADLMATFAEREAVAAEVGELTAEEGHRLGVVEGDDAIDAGDGGLVGVEEVGVLDALGVAEHQALEAEVTHRVLGLAGETQELRRHGNDRDGLVGLFARAGQVGQLAGAVEEPLTRGVEKGR